MGPDPAESQVKKAIRKSPYSVASRGAKQPRAAGDGTMTQRADPRRVGLAAPATREPHEATPYTATAARRAVATAAAHAPAPNTIATPSESMNGGSPIAAGSRHARSAASP